MNKSLISRLIHIGFNASKLFQNLIYRNTHCCHLSLHFIFLTWYLTLDRFHHLFHANFLLTLLSWVASFSFNDPVQHLINLLSQLGFTLCHNLFREPLQGAELALPGCVLIAVLVRLHDVKYLLFRTIWLVLNFRLVYISEVIVELAEPFYDPMIFMLDAFLFNVMNVVAHNLQLCHFSIVLTLLDCFLECIAHNSD